MRLKRREYTKENCPWGEDCPHYLKDECQKPCFQQDEYFWLLESSNLPESLKDDIIINPEKKLDLENFQKLHYVKINVDYFVDDGANLFISGAPGTGKTVWAGKIMRQYMMYIAYNNGYVPRCLYIHIPTYIQSLKDSFGTSNEKLQELRRLMEVVPLIIWDEIDAIDNKSFIIEDLYAKFSIRINNKLSNIFTSVKSKQDFMMGPGFKLAHYFSSCEEIRIISMKNMRGSSFFENAPKFGN